MGTAENLYREGCRKGELRLFKCSSCGALEAFARDFCPRCGAPDPSTVRAGGRGVVAAITVAHIAPNPEYRALVPYGICLVDLDEGVRVMSNIVRDEGPDYPSVDPELVKIGARVRVVFHDVTDEITLPKFVLA